jgi:hypothetical protein
MMEKGFYHIYRGYWQAIGKVPRGIFDGYPDGTIEVPLKPSALHEWQDGAWVEVTPEPVPYAPSDLSPRRFEYLLAYTGLDDVWAALEAELKGTDRDMFAQIKAQRSALSFSQAKTLGLVAMFKDTAKRVAPNADLSDNAIKAAWIVAEQVQM